MQRLHEAKRGRDEPKLKAWPRHPVIYEISTWVWLDDLSRKYGKSVHLGTVPEQEWEAIGAQGFDAVWFMGVWERSPAGIEISMQERGAARGLPTSAPRLSRQPTTSAPRIASAGYIVDKHLGGPQGLAAARTALAKRGIRLILDCVPNHVAPDHPWVSAHPEYFVPGTDEDLRRDPDVVRGGGRQGAGPRPGSLLPGVARCGPAQRLRSRGSGRR